MNITRIVVHVIQRFFSKDRETATQIMLKIQLEGKGIPIGFAPFVRRLEKYRLSNAAVFSD